MRLLLVLFPVLALAQDVTVDPCKCTKDNSKIPKKKKQYANSDYGTKCKDWDMKHRYCNNPRSLQEANRACWCPKFWCYVSKECETAKESVFFKNVGLYYSYEACGNDASQCFGETESAEDEYLDAEKEDHSKDEENTIPDVVKAVVILTVRVNEIAGTVNELSAAVAKLQTEAGFEPVVPDDLVVTSFSGGDELGRVMFTESNWSETLCPLGYRPIKSKDKCDEAALELGYETIDQNLDGKDEKMCTFYNKGDKPGVRMTKDWSKASEKVKMICRNSHSDEPQN